MSEQTFLFTADTADLGDGSFRVKPRRMVDTQQISVERAMGLLKFKDRETVYRLLAIGQLRGWKPDTQRGNGKWRIYLGSVLDYIRAREDASR